MRSILRSRGAAVLRPYKGMTFNVRMQARWLGESGRGEEVAGIEGGFQAGHARGIGAGTLSQIVRVEVGCGWRRSQNRRQGCRRYRLGLKLEGVLEGRRREENGGAGRTGATLGYAEGAGVC